ncbi:hypothetical protein BDV26DRAFT_294952 [Aspergillus bertholletiae]|uniref:Uncharacterized protein n=1 Tax=Aspergillus bertholletiae TaxID=1226010 RepID=A0A5N7B0D7_9EURO|nr:hypothetical protein BDV26DRAFT_294952 [Aspergillus bertholletiae]
MDPLTIIGLAASIAQFLDIGFRLIQGAKEIHDSTRGISQEVAELQLVVEDIKNLNRDLTTSQTEQPLSKNDLAIRALAEQCDSLADALLTQLRPLSLRPEASYRMVESFRVSMTHYMRRKEILRLWERLSLVESQLRERVTRATQQDQRSSIAVILNSLRREKEDDQAPIPNNLDDCQTPLILASSSCGGPGGTYDMSLSDLRSNLLSLLGEGRALSHRKAVIQSLTFKAMKRRHDQINTAHFKTLDWVFDRSKTTFGQWLEEQGGIYWINGLAGSGKSTLMKYISDHERTRDALSCWAGEQKLFTASFYFWNAGVDMQKSQVGLLQSILYQILRSDPCLVRKVCPNHEGSEPWDITELMQAFCLLADTTSSARFCFFIDGLDEYDGNDSEIVCVLKELARSANVKICASSRPWVAFEKDLSSSEQMFVLQDFTRQDMKNYVEAMLVQNDTFKTLAENDPRCHNLVSEITQRANGVWLWVFLVVRDLLRDITARETYGTLEARLNSLPQELNEYFSRIMERIDPFFRPDTARIFLIAVDSARPFPLYALKFLEMDSKNENYALELQSEGITAGELSTVCRDWRPRLQTRCGDLLTIHTDNSEDVFYRTTVDFIHRTARDFLRDNHHTMLQTFVPKGFNGKKTLCRMLLAMLKIYPMETFRQASNGLFSLVDEVLYYASELELLNQGASQFPILDEIDDVMSVYSAAELNHWTNGRDSPTNTRYVQWIERGQCSYLALAVQARLRQYIEYVLDLKPFRLKKNGRPLLDYALRPTRVTPSDLPYNHEREYAGIDADLVTALLVRGADPNEHIHTYGGQTPWELFVLFCYERCKRLPEDQNPYFDVAGLLVQHNANLDHMVRFPTTETYSGTTARYKTQVTIERKQAPARELLNKVFTSTQMMDLDHKMRQAKLESQTQGGGFLGWITYMVAGKG